MRSKTSRTSPTSMTRPVSSSASRAAPECRVSPSSSTPPGTDHWPFSGSWARLVVVVRRAHEPLKGQWSVPGGVLELGVQSLAKFEHAPGDGPLAFQRLMGAAHYDHAIVLDDNGTH